jgi:hypothetical protein
MGTRATAERRDNPRQAFRGTVELALPEEADSYEADAVDLSIGGMSLRTAFLPDVGSELECKFALEDGSPVAARGEVVWAQDAGADAGSFGLRFTELSSSAERAIGRILVPAPAPAPTRSEARQEASSPSADESRAKLFIPGMEAPLRARVRTLHDDVIVLGSDLSFLKLGERVEVERGSGRTPGAIEDVSVEIDASSRIARLVLTVAVESSATTTAPDEPAVPLVVSAPAAKERPRSTPPRAAQATAVLASHEDGPIAAPSTVRRPAAAVPAVVEEEEEQSAVRSSPPAWLVAALQSVRVGGRGLVTRVGPALRTLLAAVLALTTRTTTAVRARLGREPAPETAAPRSGLRKQQAVAPTVAPVESPLALAARKYGLYALAALGVVAIVVALVSGGNEASAPAPQPQVAVSSPAEAEAEGEHGEGLVAGGAMANGATAEVSPEAPMGTALPPSVGRADLRSAALSPDSYVERGTLPVRTPSRAAPGARAAAPTPRPAAAVAAAPAAGGRVLGSPNVRTGTVLRLRMDGPVTTLAGGPAGELLTVRVAGRRSLDVAAPLVRQDARIAGAGVYNRAGGAELVLRFRDAVPAYSARAVGDTLEIVLAPAAPAARPLARGAAHR